MEGGKARPRFARAHSPYSIWNEILLLKCCAPKKFWNNLQKLSAFDFISNQWRAQFCIHEVDELDEKKTSEFSKNAVTVWYVSLVVIFRKISCSPLQDPFGDSFDISLFISSSHPEGIHHKTLLKASHWCYHYHTDLSSFQICWRLMKENVS